ncbi:ABC transporter ATP-binding protein [Salipaludibacillus agaradhaerens]|uniref:ABC transporter ATP-binding protein n=1 Tax=Salipaludibacillus agaradhaerens TaxID=76935 RepID=UPI002151E2E2|nr:ABC transporter ATP-binding protein [Salipaludibacillus agaradhaerens]MCR6107422.1 ABC transporter ATP-binding protein [Salipaludibacillus agaradhaerens]MCR6119451.1 ABC transporter ATP-binding protein [Salipaludibacillus agaradhaerens]
MEVCNIKFSYGNKIQHLNNVTASIPSGEITTIIGPNGSGKSTLLQMMSKNLVPDSGDVILDGKKVMDYSPKAFAKRLAVVHQQNSAPVDITVEKLVSYGRIPYRQLFKNTLEEDRDAIDWALSCTHLSEKRQAKIHHLSGGERQRVWIAMSLAQKTPILFLDEPTTYLDMYHQFEILDLIEQLNLTYKTTIVMVLHDLNQAIRYSSHLLIMKQGKLLKEGAPEEVISEKMIKDIYGVDVLIKKNNETGLYMVPIGIKNRDN